MEWISFLVFQSMSIRNKSALDENFSYTWLYHTIKFSGYWYRYNVITEISTQKQTNKKCRGGDAQNLYVGINETYLY